MRRFFLLLIVGAAAAIGIWYGLRGRTGKSSPTLVTSLLPKETLAFVHLPDFDKARNQLRETDLYKLWREPAVQDFLQKPLSTMPNNASVRQNLREIEALGVKDTFFAVTSCENDECRMVGGFEFKGGVPAAEAIIGKWRSRLREKLPGARDETVEYQQHRIQTLRQEEITVATVYDGSRFFVANDVATL